MPRDGLLRLEVSPITLIINKSVPLIRLICAGSVPQLAPTSHADDYSFFYLYVEFATMMMPGPDMFFLFEDAIGRLRCIVVCLVVAISLIECKTVKGKCSWEGKWRWKKDSRS